MGEHNASFKTEYCCGMLEQSWCRQKRRKIGLAGLRWRLVWRTRVTRVDILAFKLQKPHFFSLPAGFLLFENMQMFSFAILGLSTLYLLLDGFWNIKVNSFICWRNPRQVKFLYFSNIEFHSHSGYFAKENRQFQTVLSVSWGWIFPISDGCRRPKYQRLPALAQIMSLAIDFDI